MRRNVHDHIRGRLSTRDVQTALSTFLICSPLQNCSTSLYGFEERVKPQSKLSGAFLSGVCIATSSRYSVRSVRTDHTDASLAGGSGLSGCCPWC